MIRRMCEKMVNHNARPRASILHSYDGSADDFVDLGVCFFASDLKSTTFNVPGIFRGLATLRKNKNTPTALCPGNRIGEKVRLAAPRLASRRQVPQTSSASIPACLTTDRPWPCTERTFSRLPSQSTRHAISDTCDWRS